MTQILTRLKESANVWKGVVTRFSSENGMQKVKWHRALRTIKKRKVRKNVILVSSELLHIFLEIETSWNILRYLSHN